MHASASRNAVGGSFRRVSPIPHTRDKVLLAVGGASPRVVSFDLTTRAVREVVSGGTAA